MSKFKHFTLSERITLERMLEGLSTLYVMSNDSIFDTRCTRSFSKGAFAFRACILIGSNLFSDSIFVKKEYMGDKTSHPEIESVFTILKEDFVDITEN